MAKLPKSGPLGLKQIGAVFEDPAPIHILQTPRTSLWQIEPSLRNKPVKFSSFYGRENTVFITIKGNLRNVNIDTLANQQRKGHVANIKVVVKAGTRIGSGSTGVPSLQTGHFANNNKAAVMHLTIEATAYIHGKGGDGGYGATASTARNGGRGTNGGDALLMNGQGTLRITNYGGIGGGGGGGGGGSGFYGCRRGSKSGCLQADNYSGEAGRAGTGNPAGRNGNGARSGNGGRGGAGGGLGAAGKAGARSGTNGKSGTVGTPGGGGAAGYGVRKASGAVVYVRTGTINGIKQ